MEIMIKLECGHRVHSPVTPRLQFPDDVHYVWCPTCRDLQNPPIRAFPFAWHMIVSVYEVPTVPDGTPSICVKDIMRVQSRKRVGKGRHHPFPYK